MIFKQNTESMIQLIAQIAHGKGKKSLNIFSKEVPFGKPLHNLIQLKSRFRRLLIDDPLFGSFLLILNLVFLGFAWRLSGFVVNVLSKLIFGELSDSQVEMTSSKKAD